MVIPDSFLMPANNFMWSQDEEPAKKTEKAGLVRQEETLECVVI